MCWGAALSPEEASITPTSSTRPAPLIREEQTGGQSMKAGRLSGCFSATHTLEVWGGTRRRSKAQGGWRPRGSDSRSTQSQSYLTGVFGLRRRHADASPTAFSLFTCRFEVSRQKKVTPSWSCGGIVEVDGQQLSLAGSLFSLFVLTVLVRILLIVEESVKLSVQCLGTKMFWWCTPRIPGISRVFQSYMNWDLGTPGSRERRDHHLEEKKEKRRHAVRSGF